MAAWCLPRSLASDFLKAITDGRLAPERLMEMSSEERRAAFGAILGPENAAEVNAQFEAKMLLKDKQRGMVSWAKKIGGITEATRQDILTKIGKLDRVLNPAEEEDFLADLAAKKLGASVTAQEAKEIFQLSQKAEQLKAAITEAGQGDYRKGWTPETGTAYGRAQQALIEKINSLKPHNQSLANGLLQLSAITREAETSILHWSAPFVQLAGMIATKEWMNGLGKMFQYFASEENYQGLIGYITSHPDYEIAKGAKLGLTNLGDKLTLREEGLQSHLLVDANQWLSDRTGVPNLIRGWQRSFVGVCNYVRFERFSNLLNAARMVGEDASLGSKVADDMAKVVNNFTGRGNLGEHDAQAAIGPILNTVFYSPRKLVATFEMFNPVMYAKLSPTARMAAIRQLSGFLAATGSTMMLARFAGAQVTFDPRSADFGKINIGGEKLDMTGGNAAYVRFLARLATGQTISASGKLTQLDSGTPGGASRKDMAWNFMTSRLAPNAAIIADAMFGPFGGGAFNPAQEVSDRLTPIVIDSFIKYYENNPKDTAALIPSLTALLGVSLESPEPPMSQSGHDVWGQPLPPYGTPRSWVDDPVNQEASRLGLYLGFPSQKIRGVQLTGDQYAQYVQTSGRMAHMQLQNLVSSSGWDAVPDAAKLQEMKSVIRDSREASAAAIMLQARGTPHDIIQQATAAKAAASGALVPIQ